ncbi:MAG TPA: substrate-binding domain-containing protein [Candidatus Limnocylindria bacterium]|nr:substrate-binding domain-containing protein [Candidatus Limnocylindria bacterium]
MTTREDRFGRKFDRRTALGYFAAGAAGLAVACAPGVSAPATSSAATAAAASPSAGKTRWGMTAAEEAAFQQIEAAARKEGTLTYYSLGTIPASQVDLFKREFAKDYPEIQIQVLNVGNSNAMTARITTEQDGKVYVADVFDQSVRAALLLPPTVLDSYISPSMKDPTVKWLYNPDAAGKNGLIKADVAQFFPIWINTNLVKPADAPKNALDVASNPKWKGQIMYRTPWTSGGGSHLYHFAKQVYGDSWVTKMQAQQPAFSEDQDAALLQVARGEYAIGLGLTGRQATEFIKAGQPIQAVWPDDFVITTTQGNHLAAHAPHPNAAKVLINWFHSERGQQLWRTLGQYPIRADIPPAEPWMQGVSKAKTVYENLMDAKEQQAEFDAAAKAFKK